MLDLVLLRLGGLFFVLQKQALETDIRTIVEHPEFTRSRAGGAINESKDSNGMHGLQAEKLYYYEEQKE